MRDRITLQGRSWDQWAPGGLWVISDTHLGHQKMVELCGRPADHEQLILDRWAAEVPPEGTVLHCGDVYWRDWRTWIELLAALPGRKLMLRGNHDKDTDARYLRAGFEVVRPFVANRIAFTHRPLYSDPEYWELPEALMAAWKTNVHGHVHNNYHHPDEGREIPGRRYVNACVEVLDYRPIRVEALIA